MFVLKKKFFKLKTIFHVEIGLKLETVFEVVAPWSLVAFFCAQPTFVESVQIRPTATIMVFLNAKLIAYSFLFEMWMNQ